jgi:hypothetical protein
MVLISRYCSISDFTLNNFDEGLLMSDPTNSDIELDVLLIENLADLDLAAQRITQSVEPAIYKAIDAELDKFARDNDWIGQIDDSYHNSVTWFGPRNWLPVSAKLAEGDEQDRCQFTFEGLLTDTYKGIVGEDWFLLTRLLALGNGKAGFRWRQLVSTKGRWRRLLRDRTAVINALQENGFSYEESEGSFYLPFRLDKDELVKAFRDEAPANALGPLRAALQTILNSKDDFEKLMSTLATTGSS